MMASVFAEDAVITLKCEKMKDAPEFPLSRWALASRGASCVLAPSDAVLANPHRDLSPAQRAVLEALAGPVFNGSAGTTELREVTNLPSTTLYRVLRALLERGFLDAEGGEHSPQRRYRLTDKGVDMI
jgi:predicted transcriptional regulator